MGVPSFFRWVSQKYPKILVEAIEAEVKSVDGVEAPVNTALPNPNLIEFDNLYLDMNGIIHPCTHPEDKDAPDTEDDMMVAIMDYIDHIFSIIRPRKLLYMAIDGVAPRAKMNQQRSRRFRSAREAEEKRLVEEEIRKEQIANGMLDADAPPKKKAFDSNAITPGSPFMEKVAQSLRFYCADRLNSDEGWKGVKIVLSDSNIPGEGEHKMMEYIRRQRSDPHHDPQTKHVIYGLDADLIMLSLATHEPHFWILREQVFFGGRQPTNLAAGAAKPVAAKKPYQLLHISVLREYLEYDMKPPNLPFPYDVERVIDDFVFLCFFVGNDFLPHLPTLEIREGAIPLLMSIYKKILPQMDGYLTDSGDVHYGRAALLLKEIGVLEDAILMKRRDSDKRYKANQRRRKQQDQQSQQRLNTQLKLTAVKPTLDANATAAEALKAQLKGNAGAVVPKVDHGLAHGGTSSRGNLPASGGVAVAVANDAPKLDEDGEPIDEVRLGETGWRERYYKQKFELGMDETHKEARQHIANCYVEGLAWVLKYYYQGCNSWKWFYPYHYAPFACDLTDIADIKIEFDHGAPFRPFEQLMSVLPAASAHALPAPFRKLMSDPDSPILDFYPTSFKIDLNGKKFAWQGVALLPFISEERLKAATAAVEDQLTEDEVRRNSLGQDFLFVSNQHKLAESMRELCSTSDVEEWVAINADLSEGLSGTMARPSKRDALPEGGAMLPPVAGPEAIRDLRVAATYFKDPVLSEGHIFKSELLPTCVLPPRILDAGDLHQGRRSEVDGAAHRMLGRYIRPNQGAGGSQGGRGGFHGGQRGGGGFGGGRGGHNGGRGGYNNQGGGGGFNRQQPQGGGGGPGFSRGGGGGGGPVFGRGGMRGGGHHPYQQPQQQSYGQQQQGGGNYSYNRQQQMGGGPPQQHHQQRAPHQGYAPYQQQQPQQQRGPATPFSSQRHAPPHQGGNFQGNQYQQQPQQHMYPSQRPPQPPAHSFHHPQRNNNNNYNNQGGGYR